MAERIEAESATLPYRWGYFHGAILIPWSLFLLIATWMEWHRPDREPLYLSIITVLLALVGFPLAAGLLQKKKFALPLVYLTFGLTLLLVGIKLPIAILHYRDTGDRGSAMGEAELLLFWLCCLIYYRKRRSQFT
ncbi:MAG TPA: hypothetical protein VGD60_11965 [Candidatus Acidoferrales bacterium]